ncbi:MAG: YybH family protein [Steroidobacteraceae bacterium]
MRNYTAAIALILMACADLAGCGNADDKLPSEVTTAVSNDFNRGDAVRAAANYANDAQILPPGHLAIEGKHAITAFFKSNIDKYLSLGNYTAWSAVRGDLAIEQGVYNVRNVRVGENVESGKYIRVWKKVDGTWKLYRDIFSPDSEAVGTISVSPEEATPSENPPAK